MDTRHRNWTVRQIVHHLADSHINSFVRYKWALTESTPVIKSYNESLWSEVVDATQSPVRSSLDLFHGLHLRWGELMRWMSDEQWDCGFFHPEMDRVVTLHEALPLVRLAFCTPPGPNWLGSGTTRLADRSMNQSVDYRVRPR